MSDENQIEIPPSFIALYVPPGRIKPTESRAWMTERYELCEDMATMLVDTAQNKLWELGITERDVLERIQAGLGGGWAEGSSDGAGGFNAAETVWVMTRLAELLGWQSPSTASE